MMNADSAAPDGPSLLRLSLVAFAGGAIAGLIGAAFRLALEQAEHIRNTIVETLQQVPGGGLVAMALAATVAALAATLVRHFAPLARGSGIPHVEAVLAGDQVPAPLMLIPVKFVGGILAIGAGLALGREGPSVQMGASAVRALGERCGCRRHDLDALLAAGAGAGLATAFNAPIAGAVFVLEELVKRFDTRHTLATLCASGAAIATARIFLGGAPDFAVGVVVAPKYGEVPAFLLMGLVMGVLGIAYNRAVSAAFASAYALRRIAPEWRAAAVGALAGLIAWFAPSLAGGGDSLTEAALGGQAVLPALIGVFALRFLFGPLCYAAETPGGLFAPMLVIGAQGGLLYGSAYGALLPAWAGSAQAYALVGMSAFFTATVRAPVTGMALVVGMTDNFTLLLPMLVACFAAMLVPTFAGNAPIYDTLRRSPEEVARGQDT